MQDKPLIKSNEKPQDLDPFFIQQVSEFHQRMSQTTHFYQQAVVLIAAERMVNQRDGPDQQAGQVIHPKFSRSHWAGNVIRGLVGRFLPFLSGILTTGAGEARNTVSPGQIIIDLPSFPRDDKSLSKDGDYMDKYPLQVNSNHKKKGN